MKYSHLALVIAGLLVLSHCTSTKIISRKTANIEISGISGMFYAMYIDQKMEKTIPYIAETSSHLYQKNSIDFEFERFSFFDNPENYTVEYLSNYAHNNGFDYFLMLHEVSYDKDLHEDPWDDDDMFPEKTITHGLEAFVYRSADATEIWRAQIEVESNEFGNSKQTGKNLAKKIITRLKNDLVLPSSFSF